MVGLAGALILNAGTLSPEWIEAMLLAGKAAQARGIPIVLDPVGAGATSLRTDTNHRLLRELKVTAVRGNAGEIGALVGAGGAVKGVESVSAPEDVAGALRQAARAWGSVVAVTGERDLISDGEQVLVVENGHRWLATLTGTGCMATTAVAAFAAVEKDALLATAGALAAFGLAAELAASSAAGPASFKVALFDQLYHLTPEQVAEGARVRRLEEG
jgi:hydroxyethylthiazole kinase